MKQETILIIGFIVMALSFGGYVIYLETEKGQEKSIDDDTIEPVTIRPLPQRQRQRIPDPAPTPQPDDGNENTRNWEDYLKSGLDVADELVEEKEDRKIPWADIVETGSELFNNQNG